MQLVKEVLAQTPQPDINLLPPGQFQNLGNLSFATIVSYGINLILIIAALAFFFLLVLGGIRWITSGGDKGQTEAARGQITAAFIGLLIVFAAWAILQIVGEFFDVDLLGNFDINPT
jgi:hypothetical protein